MTKDSYTATGAGLVQACPVLTGYHTDTSRRALALTWDRADLDKARIVRPGFLTETKQDRSKLASLASRAGLRTGMKEVWRHVPRRSGHVHGSNHPEFHPHHLRHRGVTNLADAGIDRKRSGRSSAIHWWNCSCATARSRLRNSTTLLSGSNTLVPRRSPACSRVLEVGAVQKGWCRSRELNPDTLTGAGT